MRYVTVEYGARGRRCGQEHGRAKYTDREVRLVRELYAQGMRITDIARQLDMPRETARAFVHAWRRAVIPTKVSRKSTAD